MNADFSILHHSVSARHGKHVETIHTLHGYRCAGCGCGSGFPIGAPIRPDVQAIIDAGTCPHCGTAIQYATAQWYSGYQLCCVDGCDAIGEPRCSLGLPAGHWCDHHYQTAFPYRTDGPEGFDPAFAGERYDDDAA